MKKTILYSFRRSIPIMIGFFPVGIAYGILMQTAGYNAIWTFFTSLFVFAGSLQFLMVSFFAGGFSYITIAILALLLNSRHIFYGLSFIEKFRSFKKSSKWAMIFTLADENYSLHCSYTPEEGVNEEQARVITSLLNYAYWVIFSVLGCLLGEFITINTEGIDFALTALFVVILIDQLKGSKSALPAVIAVVSSIICIIIFGADSFILPSLSITCALLLVLKDKLENTLDSGEEAAK